MVAACPFPANRGTPSRILRMAEALSLRNHQVHVVSYHINDSSIGMNNSLNIHRIKPFFNYDKMEPGPSFKKPFLDFLLAMKIVQVARKENIEIIHAHHIEGLVSSIIAAKMLRIPLIYDAHVHVTNELEIFGVFANESFGKKVTLFFEKMFVYRANAIVAVSAELGEILSSFGYPQAKIWVVPTGTNLEHFRNKTNSEDKMKIKESLGLSEKEPLVMYTGTITPYQGLEHLINSMDILLRKVPSAKLVIIGGGSIEKYSKLCDDKKISESVIFTDEKPFNEIPSLLSIADVAVSPRTEASGIPQKLTNYMAAGIPIVSFKGSAKILEHRKTGYIVENEDVEGFAGGIRELIENIELHDELAKNALEEVEKFTWPNLVQKCEDIYLKVKM
ncbi:glycosyltransferase family 4 protein [Methanolobus halotolerans]|nr:glycosyltransferase family 4 protein [Methanolobus halotolerans]